jgi:gliding motility-associated-like protein
MKKAWSLFTYRFVFYLPLFLCFSLLLIGTVAFAQPACPAVSVSPSSTSICSGCTTLTASVQGTVTTTSYSVSTIPYVPFSYNTGTSILVNIDDTWSDPINIPFCFEFYGNTYNQVVIGSNDVITFDASQANGSCPWSLTSSGGLPDAGLPTNSIMCPFQDLDPTNTGNIYWQVIGTAPCRTFIVSFYQIPYYGDINSSVPGSCNTSYLATSQVVFYETTNIIDIYIKDKNSCNGWNNGFSVEGIQDITGTLATVVPGRNNTVWTATNDAYRFTPTGAPQYNITWYNSSNTVIGNSPSVSVCPAVTSSYRATVVNNTCGGPIIVSDTVTVHNIGIQSISFTTTNAFCLASNGTATATANAGTSPYTYLWTPSGQTTQTATGLASGVYSVSITDSSGCTATNTVTVPLSPPVTFSFTSVTNVNCFGNSTGSASINVLSGTSPYTYSWTPSAQTTSTATALHAGTYTVVVTDSAGCAHTDSVTITSPTLLTHSFSPIKKVSCFGNHDGSDTIHVAGGTPGYSYAWSNSQTSQAATGLSAGTYSITVTDAHGCSFIDSVTITSPAPLTHSFSGITNVDCFGDPTGGATVNVLGGTIPYTYSWNSIPTQTTQTVSTLYAGVYTVTVLDSNACIFKDSVTIVTPTGLGVPSPIVTNVTCFGNSNGSITVAPYGGTPGYTYLWIPGSQTGATATGLGPGVDTVRITDTNGCITKTLAQITEPTVLTSTPSHTNIFCFGDSTGTASVLAAGGSPTYAYIWSNGSTASNISHIPIGTYSVITTDAHGCRDSASVTITQSAQLSDVIGHTNIRCFGDSTGTATVAAAGGISPYTYLWTPGAATTAANTGMYAGTYHITITDSSGCTHIDSVALTQPAAPLSIANTVVQVLCNHDSTGSISVIVIGGTPSYSYLWTTGQTASGISHLPIGNYQVMVTDTNGCRDSSMVTIIQPLPLTAMVSNDTSICPGASVIENCVAVGGTPGYTYLWTPLGITTSSITVTPLLNTTYSVQVTDTNGCVSPLYHTTVTMIPPPVVSISISPSATVLFPETICFSGDTAHIANWIWNFGDGSTGTTSSICHDFSKMGAYCVKLQETTNLGCIDTTEKCILEVGAIVPNVFSPNGDGINDEFLITMVADGIISYRCEIFDRWGLKLAELHLPMEGWDGRNTAGLPAPDGTYYYTFSISWENGFNIHKAGFFSLVR